MTSRPEHVIVDELDPDEKEGITWEDVKNTGKQAWDSYSNFANNMYEDDNEMVRDISQQLAEFKLDAQAFKTGANLMPTIPHPLGGPALKLAGGGVAVLGRRKLFDSLEEILSGVSKGGRIFSNTTGDELSPQYYMSKSEGTGGIKLGSDQQGSLPLSVLNELPPKWRKLLVDGGYPEHTYDVYQKSNIKNKKFILDEWVKAGRDREGIALVQNPIFSQNTFDNIRQQLLPEMLKELGHIKDLNPKLHHIFSLRASAPLFDGLTIGSKQYKTLIKDLISEGIFAGHNPKNLKLLSHDAHEVVHKYLNDYIGKQGEIFFTPERIKLIQSGSKGRTQVAKEYAAIVRNSRDVMITAHEAYRSLYGVLPQHPDELIRIMSKIDPTTKYTLPQIKQIITEVNTSRLRELEEAVLRGKSKRVISKDKKDYNYLRNLLKRTLKDEGITPDSTQGNLLGDNKDIPLDL